MSQKGHPFPASGAFMIDNSIRRWLQPPSELIDKIAIGKDDTVIDFGCGPGFYTIELAKRAKSVIAVDVSPDMLAKAKNKATKAETTNIQFLQSDGKKIQLPDATATKIILVTVFHEIGDSEAVLKEFIRIMKPNGTLIIAEIVKKSIVPGAPVQNPETLKAEVESNGFALQQMLPYKSFGIFSFQKASNP